MATHITDLGEGNAGMHLLRTGTWARPNSGTGIHLAAYTTAAVDAGTATEAAYTNYSRPVVAQDDVEWTLSVTATGIRIENANPIPFPTPGAAGPDLISFGACAGLAATPLIAADLVAPVTVANGDPIVFAANTMSFEVNQLLLDGTDVLFTRFLDHIFRSTAWAKPAGLNGDLHTVMPLKAGNPLGTIYSGNGYAPVPLGPNDSIWGDQTAGNGIFALLADQQHLNVPSAAWNSILGCSLNDGTDAYLIRQFAGARNFIANLPVKWKAATTRYIVS